MLSRCRDAGAHVTVQGGRTSLVAGTVPEHDDVLLSTERLTDVGDVDTVERRIRVGAGVDAGRCAAGGDQGGPGVRRRHRRAGLRHRLRQSGVPGGPSSTMRSLAPSPARVAKVPSDLQALNKRVVHRAMDAMGIRDEAAGDGRPQRPRGSTSGRPASTSRSCARDVTHALDAHGLQFGDYRVDGSAWPPLRFGRPRCALSLALPSAPAPTPAGQVWA